jgi:hypothetical protein
MIAPGVCGSTSLYQPFFSPSATVTVQFACRPGPGQIDSHLVTHNSGNRIGASQFTVISAGILGGVKPSYLDTAASARSCGVV